MCIQSRTVGTLLRRGNNCGLVRRRYHQLRYLWFEYNWGTAYADLVEAYAASAGANITRLAGGDPEQVELKLTGQTGVPLALIDIRSHGSGTAVPALVSGKASIGMLSRPMSDKEAQTLLQTGLPDLRNPGYAHVLAMDGILVLVSPDNPMGTLSLDQIAGIFAGTIRDWSAVGGAPGPIHIYARDDKSRRRTP